MSGEKADAPGFTLGEKETAWSCYCASYAGVVQPDESPRAWDTYDAAALAIGAECRLRSRPLLTRSALLAEVAANCGEEAEAGYDAGIIDGQVEGAKDVLDKLEKWIMGDSRSERIPLASVGEVTAWIREQRKAVSS